MSVSVAITSYKYGHLVAQAIESVLSQTRKPDEVLVVDDGIGDCEFVTKLYPEVKYIFHENYGIVKNYNDVLMNQIKTDKLMMLGGDNWLDPEAIELMDRNEDIVSCDAYIVGEGKYSLWQLPWQPHGSALYKVKMAIDVGGYASSGNEKTEEDSVLFKKMFEREASFYRVERPLLYYRRHRANYNG